MTAVFTPSNEPYLGRESVFHFDQMIISCLEGNSKIAEYTRQNELSDLQRACCELIPHGINLALSIRELVRQGYLFAAVVLMRSLIERAAIVSYLHEDPERVAVWQNGWKSRERPRLAEMMVEMRGTGSREEAQKICNLFNHAVHGDPIGASFNLVRTGEGGLGYSVGKALNEPELCDFICFQSYCYLFVLMGRMAGCFPGVGAAEELQADKDRPGKEKEGG